ncbi:hypothetical protein KK090_02450 [Curtobacterium flaccumfaciens pv. poinsettiae]|uniref:type II toxin-antitoxin system Phd/YefM family antitoxin n=1 Tax=Curtobacterium poinsettiae TaxID=159612 RepID=UPI001BDFE326|nr:hypothetical protein [Curtobacterium flaccumfaciens]MBT1618109.1 hypothetical protein [Curtobacterium flaccumfaciens pv. poinsettiae]
MTSSTRKLGAFVLDLAATQHGLLTAEQLPIPLHSGRRYLRGLARVGEVTLLEAGVYLHASHPQTPTTLPLAAYIATRPDQALTARRSDDQVVVRGAGAAALWGLNGLLQDTVILSQQPIPQQRRFADVQYETGLLAPTQIVRRSEYLVPSIERVIADALQFDGDLEHVADAMQVALWQHYIHLPTLQAMVEEQGSDAMNGTQTWDYLVAAVGGWPHHDGFQYPVRPDVKRRRTRTPGRRSLDASSVPAASTTRHDARTSALRMSEAGSTVRSHRAEVAQADDLDDPRSLLRQVERGVPIVILRNDHPVATLLPIRRISPRIRSHRASRLRTSVVRQEVASR